MSAESSGCKKSSRLRPLLGVFPPTFHVATNNLHPNHGVLTLKKKNDDKIIQCLISYRSWIKSKQEIRTLIHT